jgi:hypothetical protein
MELHYPSVVAVATPAWPEGEAGVRSLRLSRRATEDLVHGAHHLAVPAAERSLAALADEGRSDLQIAVRAGQRLAAVGVEEAVELHALKAHAALRDGRAGFGVAGLELSPFRLTIMRPFRRLSAGVCP